MRLFSGKFKIDIDIDENREKGYYDEGDTAVNHCLKNRTQEVKGTFDSQSTYDPTKIHPGRLIVYRFNIKCLCKDPNQKCAKMLPMSQQGWGGYMGTLANGFYNERIKSRQ